MAIQNKSNHINFIQVQIRLIPIHIRLFITITTEAINQLPLEITFRDLGCPLNPFGFVLLIFIFKSVATRIPYLTRLADPSWSPVYSDVFNQNIYFVLLNFSFQKCRDPNPRLDSVGGSKLEPGLLRHFQLSFQNICLCYSILDFLITRKHFFSGNPINTYNFKGPLTFSFNKMHLQNDAFLLCPCNVKDT